MTALPDLPSSAIGGPLQVPGDSQLPVLGSEIQERADAARNRRRILAAAERLLAAHGVENLTMDAIACAAKVGKGTLFRRFGDRGGLLHALLNEREQAFQDGFIRGPAPLGPGAPTRTRLIAFGHGLLDMCERQGPLLMAADSGEPDRRLLHIVYGTYRAHVTALLREAAPQVDVDYAADALLGPLAPGVVMYQRNARGMELERLKAGWDQLVAAVVACPISGREPGT